MQQDINSQEMPPLSLEAYRVLLPSIGGLALASTVVNVVVQQAHRTTGVSTFNGLSMLVSALAIGVLFLSTFLVKRFTKRFISAFTFASIHLAGFSCLALALLTASGIHVSLGLAVALQACVTVGSTFLKFYWLRKLRGTSAQAAVIVVFCALAISEFATYCLSFSGELIWYTAGTLLSFAQFSAVRVSRKLGALPRGVRILLRHGRGPLLQPQFPSGRCARHLFHLHPHGYGPGLSRRRGDLHEPGAALHGATVRDARVGDVDSLWPGVAHACHHHEYLGRHAGTACARRDLFFHLA